MRKNILPISITVTLLTIVAVFVGCGKGLYTGSEAAATTYTQVERLGRPAINEGLVLSNSNLVAFNSIPPSLDLRTDITAVNNVLTEAGVVLDVVQKLAVTAGLGAVAPSVTTTVSQFLPDVLRISTNDSDYGTLHALVANADRTSRSAQNEVGYTACVSVTAGAPLLCGGRKIRDDVIDITLSYLVGGAGAAAPASVSPTNGPGYLVSDNVGWTTSHPAGNPLLATFPFLAAPL